MASAAATNDLLKSLRDTVNCSVCQDVFTDPVTLDCGDNFCRFCITQCWKRLKGYFPCPKCRKRFRKGTMRPNPQLEEIAKQVQAPAVKQSEGEKLCETHKKPLNLYYLEEDDFICETCDLSFKYRHETVIPIEDAAKERKDELQKVIQDYTSKKEATETLKLNEEKKIAALLTKTETERQKIVSYFARQHQILKEEEQHLLGELEEMEEIIQKSKDEYITELSEEIADYDKFITKRKKWCQMTAEQILNVDEYYIERDYDARARSKDPNPVSPQLEMIFSNFYKKFKILKDAVITERDDVTLDPETAHPVIAVSEDGRSARKVSLQTVPNSPKRFDAVVAVLGSEGFTSGSHCWEAEVGLGEDWAVGIATESVKRKELFTFDSSHGIWSVWMIQNKTHPSYWAATAIIPVPAIPVPWIPASVTTIPAPPTPIATIQAPMTTIPALATPIARIQAPIPALAPAASSAAAPAASYPAAPAPAASYAAAPVLAASCGAAPAASYPAAPATAMPMASNQAMVWTSTTMQAPSAIPTETLAPTSQSKPSIKIRVCLDYDRGLVTFHRSDNMAPSFTYCATFTEKIFPFFWLWSEGAWVRLCP